MKKIFSLLSLALLTMSAWAATTVTLDFTAQGYDNQQEVSSLTVDGVTVAFDKGSNSNTPKYYTSGASVRVYGGGTVTVSTDGSDPITGITFTYGSGDGSNAITSDVGTFDSPNWTGSESAVVFSIGGTSGNRRFAKVEVTLGGEVVETIVDPVISPASGSFTDSVNVSITCGTAGATIEYSTDNQTWTEGSSLTIHETTTVYARATKGNLVSNVVSATYTKVVPVQGNLIAFNPANDKGDGSTTRAPWTVTKNGVTIYCSDGTVYDANYRIYQNATLKFTTNGEIGNIVKIEFESPSGNPASNLTMTSGNGAYSTTDAPNGTWVGTEADSVVFKASAQARANAIRVYVDGDLPVVVIAAPTIPASQEFEESITVEITNNEDGADLYYKTTGDWTPYTEALTFTETTTLQAKAVKGTDESEVVSATYTKVEPAPEYTTLAQVNVLGNGADFEFKGNVVVTAQKKNYLWLRDESGYGLIYGNINNQNNLTFAPGTVLNQGWTAQTKIYSGLMEYVEANNVSASEDTNPTLAAIQTITELDTTMVNAYVQVLNVKSFAVNGRNVTATMLDGTQMVMYNTFDESIPTEEGNYTVEGAVSTHNGMQLIIIGIEGFVPETIDVDNIAQAYELNPNTTFTMYNDVVVTYHDTVGNRLFIRDTEDNSGMIYGALEGEPTFNNGDVLSDGWTATFSVYQNTPEFTNAEGIAASGDTREAAPFERNAEEIDIMNVHEYIVLKNQTVLPDNTGGSNSDKRFFIDLPNDSLVLFNQFNVELPAIEEGKTYDVTGIVTIYRSKAQVYILEMTENAPAFTRGDVDMDGFVRISDVTALINYLLTNDPTGIDLNAADTDQDTFVKISDVTTLINYLLSGNWE